MDLILYGENPEDLDHIFEIKNLKNKMKKSYPKFSDLEKSCSFSTIFDVGYSMPGMSKELHSDIVKFNSNTNLSKQRENPVIDGIVLGYANPLRFKNYDLLGLSLCELDNEQNYLVPFYAKEKSREVLFDEDFGFKTGAVKISELESLVSRVEESREIIDSFPFRRDNVPSNNMILWSFFASFYFTQSSIPALTGVAGLTFADCYLNHKKRRDEYYKDIFDELKRGSLKTFERVYNNI